MDSNRQKSLRNDTSSLQKVNEKLPEEKDVLSPNSDPLQLDVVVQRIMSFLNIKQLKLARLVSKFWATEGREQLLRKYYLSAKPINDSSETRKEDFVKFLSLSKPSTMFKLVGQGIDLIDVLEEFPQLAERVRVLKYKKNDPYYATSNRGLTQALKKLPHLEILDTNCLYLRHINKFYDKLKSLKDIRLDFPLTSDTTNVNFMSVARNLKNISKIVVDKPDVLMVHFLLEWPLDRFCFKIGKLARQIRQSAIRQFFIGISDTLKYLHIDLSIEYDKNPNLTAQKPWKDDWLIPVNFPVLETMFISGSDENVWSLLTIALQLPRLKKLKLTEVPFFMDKRVRQWEQNSSAKGKKLQSLSIEEVELTCPVKYSSSSLLTGKLWPNLKSLKLNLYDSSGLLTPHLFSHWEGLERLELDLKFLTLSEFALCQEWLMGGVPFPKNYKNGSVTVKAVDALVYSSSPPSKLLDLHNLKSLTIHPPPYFSFLGDFLVYNCFQFMTNLQGLYFYGQLPFSNRASLMLPCLLDGVVLFNGRRMK